VWPIGVSGRRSEEGGDFFFPAATGACAEDVAMSALSASSSTSQLASPPPLLDFSPPPSALTSSPSGMVDRNSSRPPSSAMFHRSSRMGPGPGSTADVSFIGSVHPAFYRSRLSRTLLRTRIGRCPNRPGLTRVQKLQSAANAEARGRSRGRSVV
jgi:hypothetical protein